MKAHRLWITTAFFGVNAILAILLYLLFASPSLELQPSAEQLEKARIILVLIIAPFFILDLLLISSFFKNGFNYKKKL